MSTAWGSDAKSDVAPATPAEAEWVATQRKWGQGWRRFVLPGVLTVYLLYVVNAVGTYSHGSGRIWGYAVIAAFALCYLVTVANFETASPGRFWTFYGILAVLFVVELPSAHAAAFVMCVYITMVTVGRLGGYAAPLVIALAFGALLIPVAIPSWHDSLRTSFDDVTPIAIPVVALAMFAVARMQRGNQALAEARQELARLAAENERTRIARDLHDLLGHSLTTITVKAGLARRLGQTDPTRALGEIAEVEALARQSLADVRAAVSNYREVTLAGELASGRELLRAAGVTADIPRAVEVVDPVHQELFGWAVREGVTNIVRHAHASSCAVRLSPSSVEIVDDGVGGREGDRRWPTARQRPGRTPRAGCRGRRGGGCGTAAAAGVATVGVVGSRRRCGVSGMIRLLLADDQELIRSALAALLSLEQDFEVVASVGRGDEVVAAASAHHPDVALLDIEMPGIDGVAVARVLAQEVPECRSLILTTFGRPGYLRRAMESGASGFVVKDAPAEQLADAIRRVAAGQRVVDPALAAQTLTDGASPLTARERDVLVAARPGSTVSDIAQKLFLSEGTVRNYLSAAIAKTGARNRTEAVRRADEQGWL